MSLLPQYSDGLSTLIQCGSCGRIMRQQGYPCHCESIYTAQIMREGFPTVIPVQSHIDGAWHQKIHRQKRALYNPAEQYEPAPQVDKTKPKLTEEELSLVRGYLDSLLKQQSEIGIKDRVKLFVIHAGVVASISLVCFAFHLSPVFSIVSNVLVLALYFREAGKLSKADENVMRQYNETKEDLGII